SCSFCSRFIHFNHSFVVDLRDFHRQRRYLREISIIEKALNSQCSERKKNTVVGMRIELE
ncbi:hypothetical protein PENTCL1PPCAC_6082, partial [Pristionchus entomophagus]